MPVSAEFTAKLDADVRARLEAELDAQRALEEVYPTAERTLLTDGYVRKYESEISNRRAQRDFFIKAQPKITFPEVGPFPAPSWEHARKKQRKKKERKPKVQTRAEWQQQLETIPPHLLADPMTSPTRVMRNWEDNAIIATFRHCRDQQLLRIYNELKFQLRRTTETVDEYRVISYEDRMTCLSIVQSTSEAAYKASSVGWDRSSKETEVNNKDMMYLVVRTSDGSSSPFDKDDLSTDIVAFVSFMIEYDDPPNRHRQVVYIYEVHVAHGYRGRGLGRLLMFVVEAMAQSVSINKTMLTVFKSNKDAIKAYEKMGYTKDESSPEDKVTRNRTIECDYMIMSKTYNKSGGIKF